MNEKLHDLNLEAHLATQHRIDVLTKRVDSIQSCTESLMTEYEHLGDMLKTIMDQQLKQKVLLDVLHEELLLIKQKLGT